MRFTNARKQHTHTSKAFLDATAEFRIIQNKYKDKYKERVKRHISITKPDATPQEIELYAKKLGDSIDQADTITAIVTQQSVNASLEQAKSQNKEILELEHNISDLYHLFNEMSTMLSVQNDYITGSEEFIQKANKNANLGIRELHTGVKYHKRSKKKIMYIVISVITAIFFFLAMSLVKLQA